MKLTMHNVSHLEINKFLGEKIDCECGKTHYMNVDEVIIKNGAIEMLGDILKKYKYQKALVVDDSHTHKAAGEKVIELLAAQQFDYKLFVYAVDRDLVPDENALGKLLVQIEKNIDVLVVIGSGVLNDIAKFISKQTNIPMILVATAPSMDGFVSNTSALTINNLKTSVSCNLPQVIIGDLDILQKAPKRMILAGLGDMIGKYSALIDWQLSRLINNEYYCEPSAQISRDAIEKCVKSVVDTNDNADFDAAAIKNIMEGLIRTGIAMSYVGNSRPASGSEHHMSHYWEMMFLFAGKEALFHGTKVGLTSIIIANIYEWFAKEKTIDFDAAKAKIKAFNETEWTNNITGFYGKAASGIIANAKKDQRNAINMRLKRVEFIKEHFSEIIDIIKTAQKASSIESLMKKAGAPIRPQEVGIDASIVHNSVLTAHEVRERYTILNMLSDLGMLEKYAQQVDTYISTKK